MPQKVKRLLAARSKAGCQFQRPLQFAHLLIDFALPRGRVPIACRRTYASGPADDDPVDFQRVATDRSKRLPQQRADSFDAVPPGVVVARRENFGSRQGVQPGKIRLQITMVPRHGQIAGEKHQVPGLDRLSPPSLDPGRMIAPSRGITLASLGTGKREVQVSDCPDIHGRESLPSRAEMGRESRVKSLVATGIGRSLE